MKSLALIATRSVLVARISTAPTACCAAAGQSGAGSAKAALACRLVEQPVVVEPSASHAFSRNRCNGRSSRLDRFGNQHAKAVAAEVDGGILGRRVDQFVLEWGVSVMEIVSTCQSCRQRGVRQSGQRQRRDADRLDGQRHTEELPHLVADLSCQRQQLRRSGAAMVDQHQRLLRMHADRTLTHALPAQPLDQPARCQLEVTAGQRMADFRSGWLRRNRA